MSRGLGRLQQRILDTLPLVKGQVEEYGGVTRLDGLEVWLPASLYDLHVSRWFLAPDRPGRLDRSYQAAFTRAVRTLIARDLLLPYTDWVPVERLHDPQGRYAKRYGYTPAEMAAKTEIWLGRSDHEGDKGKHVRFVARRTR